MSVAAVLAGERAWWVEAAHVLDGLAMLPDGCVQTCTTSPPYWGLRSYGTEPQIWGGDPSCSHTLEATPTPAKTGGTGEASAKQVTNAGSQFGNAWAEHGERISHPQQSRNGQQGVVGPRDMHPSAGRTAFVASQGATCPRCGAWRGELGSEPAPALFVAHIVAVFAEVRRVLRPDGTLWLNIGDSYASGSACARRNVLGAGSPDAETQRPNRLGGGLKEKDLCLIPERLALALQDDGWYIRSRICWAKMAPMPESVTDRPTSAWEHIWLLSKAPRYAYDADAVRQPHARLWDETNGGTMAHIDHEAAEAREIHQGNNHRGAYPLPNPSGANLRNFWLLPPEPFPSAHFATFPTEIPRRCILAGSRGDDVVLDCFAGAGTTGLVARRLNRRFIGLELNPEYARMARERIVGDCPLFESAEVPA